MHYVASSLTAAEAARYDRMRSPQRRLQWQVSRALLAHVGSLDRARSLSHSGEYAAVAVDETALAVGIDLEVIRPRNFMRLAQAAFAPTECREFEALDPGAHARHFYQLWTLKEAFAKALQLPLAAALRDCIVDWQGPRWSVRVPTEHPWRALSWQPRPDLILTLVSIGTGTGAFAPRPGGTCAWPVADASPWQLLHELSSADVRPSASDH